MLPTRLLIPLLLAGCSDYGFTPDPDGFATDRDDRVDVDPNDDVGDDPGDTRDDAEPDCFKDPITTLEQVLYFEARQGCDWGVDGNGEPRNEFSQARVLEERTLDLPAGAPVCGLALHSETATLWFDDHVTLTLNEYVLVGGGSGYPMDVLPTEGDLYRFDWDALYGTPFEPRDAPYWCLGADSTCMVPPTDQEGRLELDLDEDSLASLTAAVRQDPDITFGLRTFGDDNDSDCSHNVMSLRIEVQTVLK
jgi:hypothetical protein